MSNGFIYFISDNNGHIKIGVTEDVERRIKELQTGNAMQLSLVHKIRMASMKDAYELEALLHNVLDDHKVKNEWYKESAVMRLLRHNWIHIGRYKFRGIGVSIKKLVLFVFVMIIIVTVLSLWR